MYTTRAERSDRQTPFGHEYVNNKRESGTWCSSCTFPRPARVVSRLLQNQRINVASLPASVARLRYLPGRCLPSIHFAPITISGTPQGRCKFRCGSKYSPQNALIASACSTALCQCPMCWRITAPLCTLSCETRVLKIVIFALQNLLVAGPLSVSCASSTAGNNAISSRSYLVAKAMPPIHPGLHLSAGGIDGSAWSRAQG
jgi:hypothetical protein